MSDQYHSNLVEEVASSFYYYTNHKDLDLTNLTEKSFEDFSNGWVRKYHGDWGTHSATATMTYNTFKPCVDQLVYRILTATEDEIERRVAERVNEYISKLEQGVNK